MIPLFSHQEQDNDENVEREEGKERGKSGRELFSPESTRLDMHPTTIWTDFFFHWFLLERAGQVNVFVY